MKLKLTTNPAKFWGVLVLIFILFVGTMNAQQINLDVKNKPFKEVLKTISDQTEYKFVYSDALKEINSSVTALFKNASVKEVFDSLFTKRGISYKITEKQVLLTPVNLVPSDKKNASGGSMEKPFEKKTITGVITDETKQPLTAVTVRNFNSKSYSVSNDKGEYSIVASKGDRLNFSIIGMVSKEVIITGETTVYNIELVQDNIALKDIIVVGYGSSARKDFTGSVSSVKADEIRTLPSLSIDDALSGRASGVAVVKADGSPGGAVRMRIRGASSLVGATDPLYIIDGVPTEVMNNYISSVELVNPTEAANYGEDFNSSISGSFARGLNNLSGLNTNDIESIDILKDASATAIYGSKAANGVVIITTKKGKRDSKPVLNFNYYYGVSNPIKEKVLNAQQYKNALIKAAQTAIVNIDANYASLSDPTAKMYFNIFTNSKRTNANKLLNTPDFFGDSDTDWLDLVLRQSATHNADISLSGGGQSSRYYTSLSYTNQDGTLIGTDFQRLSGKVSLDNDITKKVRMSTNINFGYTKNNITNGLYSQALYAPPVFSPFNEDMTYSSLGDLSSDYMGFQNPLAVANSTNEAKTYMLKGSLGIEVDILQDLRFKSTASIDFSSYNQLNYVPSYVDIGGFYGREDSQGGTGSQAHSTIANTFFENTLTYDKIFNSDHRLNMLLGTSWEDKQSSFFSATGAGYPDDDFLNNLSSAAQATSVKGSNPASRSTLLSFYLRINYVLKEKYLFTFTGRSDASSKFGPKNRVGYFPSGAIAWRLSEENFLKDVSWIDEIKLRASMGKTGTQRIGDHMWRTLYNVGSYADKSALIPAQLGNNEIKWESTVQKDLGLDFTLFNQRIGGTIGYYHKITDGALLNMTPAPSSGFNTVVYNLATIRNEGLEMDLRADFIHTRNFTWTGSLNIARNISKVMNIAGDAFSDPNDRENLNLGTSIVKEGEPLGLLYGRIIKGIITNEEQLNNYKSQFTEVLPSVHYWILMFPSLGIGSFEYELDEGMPKLDIIGNANPDFFGGYNNTFSYKNFALTTLFTFSYGNDLMYQKDVNDMSMSSLANRGVSVLDGYSETNTSSKRPISTYGTTNFLTNANIYDASYLKLKSLSVSYSFTPKVLNKLKLSGLLVYINGTNLFTITKYPGPDPEVSDDPSSIIGGGRDISAYPTTRTYTMGLRLSF
ncbi:MAG: SusC/RagA family TonB-linked outer membrane protein [Bacteroidales bacterium]|nr:SusC/RagA family TonB-linked outer membrane protein [Bacteroidales bacterium]MDD2424436.1 SusC/RagA family TonB-linked outer membrane protein [Bacteroidales bacterium]MDD3990240.1 SusC/RagA family TonB-linked outer membrane protein [Bacteroidales bacterium]